MWSFIATLILFLVVTVSAAFAHARQRKRMDDAFHESEKAIIAAGEVAQRRHTQRFGREDSGLQQTLSMPTRPPRMHKKA
jgi:hypothetical protein